MEYHTATEKGVGKMLCLALAPGEYMTIGDNIVVQVDRMSGDRCKLIINAPREIPIVRGSVREREGGERPGCVFDGFRWRKPEISWNRSKSQALAAMRALLSEMDGRDSNVQALRRQLNHMFPESKEQINEVSNG